MRISDWSSDVCSSDLQLGEFDAREQRERQRLEEAARQLTELEQQALSAEEHETATQSTLIESEDDAHEEQRRWDSFQQDAEAPLTQTEAERVRVQQLERARFQGEERLKRLEAALDRKSTRLNSSH